MVELRWLRRALVNLDEQTDYIARDNPEAAFETFEQIRKSVDKLKTFPALGRNGRVTGTRELVITGTPFIVPYRLHGAVIEILRVIHSARKWPTRF